MVDTEKMFHQVFVKSNDTNSSRFLWRESPEKALNDYNMLVHIFGKVDPLCCFNWDLQKGQDQTEKSLGEVVPNNFDMDDFLFYFSDEESLIKLTLIPISRLKILGLD